LNRKDVILQSPEVQNAEIVDWWETERFYVWSECSRQNSRLTEMANDIIDGLSATDTFWFESDARDDLRRKISSEIELHNRRLAAYLSASYEQSKGRIEALSGLDGASSSEYATVAASLAAGAGALGLAVGAGAFVPMTSVMLFVIPVATLASWPLVATLGLGAAAAAWVSPKIGAYAIEMVKERYKKAIQTDIHRQLLSEDESAPLSSWKDFSTQLDSVLQSRLHK